MSEEENTSQEVEAPQMSDIAKEIAASQAEVAQEQELDAMNYALVSNVEVPISDFWDNTPSVKEEVGVSESHIEEEAPISDVPGVSDDQIISYKANGEELQMSVADIRNKLAKMDGNEKAFNQLAKTRKEMKELERPFGFLRSLDLGPAKKEIGELATPIGDLTRLLAGGNIQGLLAGPNFSDFFKVEEATIERTDDLIGKAIAAQAALEAAAAAALAAA